MTPPTTDAAELKPPMMADGSPQPFRTGPQRELWGLLNVRNGGWVPALDCAGEPLLAYTSFEDAQLGAKVHWEMYEVDCIPRRFDA